MPDTTRLDALSDRHGKPFRWTTEQRGICWFAFIFNSQGAAIASGMSKPTEQAALDAAIEELAAYLGKAMPTTRSDTATTD